MSRIPFKDGAYYHIYNHAVGNENIFRENENYLFFLRKFSSRIISFADILAYCLMPNHFHFVLRIKPREELLLLWQDKLIRKQNQQRIKGLPMLNEEDIFNKLITIQFANFFNSYVQSYNKKYSRMGSLLKESFQRKRIDTKEYLLRVICYVHNNPIEHGFTVKKEDWKYSSYNAIINNGKTNLIKDDVLEIFGGKENFIFVHHNRNLGVEI